MIRSGGSVLRWRLLPLVLLLPLFSWGQNSASADGVRWSGTARWLDSSEVRDPAARARPDSGGTRARWAERRADGSEEGEKARETTSSSTA